MSHNLIKTKFDLLDSVLTDAFDGIDSFLAEDNTLTVRYQLDRVRESLEIAEPNTEEDLVSRIVSSDLFLFRARSEIGVWKPEMEAFSSFRDRSAEIRCWVGDSNVVLENAENRADWLIRQIR